MYTFPYSLNINKHNRNTASHHRNLYLLLTFIPRIQNQTYIKFAKFLSILIYHLLLKSPNTQGFNQTVQYLNSLLANLRLYKIPMTAIVLALFYMHRLHSVAPEITITKVSEGLLFAIALMVACKYHCDETYHMR